MKKSLAGFVLSASIIMCSVINVNAEDYELIKDENLQPAIAHMEEDGEGSEHLEIDQPERIIHTGDSVGFGSDISNSILKIYIDGSTVATIEKGASDETSQKWTNENYSNLMYNELRSGGTENRDVPQNAAGNAQAGDGGTQTQVVYSIYELLFRNMANIAKKENSVVNNNFDIRLNDEISHSDSSYDNHASETTEAAPVETAQVAKASTSDLLAVAPAYAVGLSAITAGTTVGPVNAATVNYANLAAKLLVSPSAEVYKTVTLSGNSSNVTLAVQGLANGQKVTILAYDLATGTWKKISATVKNGNVSFARGNSTVFSIVVDMMNP